MSLEQTLNPPQERSPGPLSWLLVALGLAAMYVPSFVDLLHGVWGSERNAHGPIVLVVACVYLGVRIRQLRDAGLIERQPAPLAGSLMVLLGLLCFALGRAQTVLFMEAGSLIPILAGIVLLVYGVKTCRRLWFAFFFMLFMVQMNNPRLSALPPFDSRSGRSERSRGARFRVRSWQASRSK